MQGLRLIWSDDNTISENSNERRIGATKIYAEKSCLDAVTLLARLEWSTYAKVPGCLCGPIACSPLTEGAPPPDTGGQALPFCGFILWTGEECKAGRLVCLHLLVYRLLFFVWIADIPVRRPV